MQQGASAGGHTESAGSTVRFGDLLRRLREQAGLTQEELAERAGLTAHAVSALERGIRERPYPHTVRSLASGLGLDEVGRAELLAAVPKRQRGAVRSADAIVPSATPETTGPATTGPVAPAEASVALAPSTPLHGRAHDIAAVSDLVRNEQRRLVTLTGLGGIGKTRLAAAVAERLRPDYPDGAVLVGLAHVADPERVLPEVAAALGVPGVDGADAAARLLDHLRPLRMVLVLDNLEQVLGAAHMVAELVAGAPGITVLATSRAPLRVRVETEYPVSPLGTPSAGSASIEELAAAPAGAMFLERARAVAPDLHLSTADVAAVSALCRRLSGIPLAVELAAAHLRLLDPQALFARLDDLMGRAGARDLPDRQRTMHLALEWSRELLTGDEQTLLRRLSVFRGSSTLEAIETVCTEGPDGTVDVLSALGGLVEHSLVVASADGHGGRRYGMLEPVAQYAAGLLRDDEAVGVRRRHTRYYLGLAEEAAPAYTGEQQIAWLARLEREDANLAVALSRSLDDGEPDITARIGWALWLYWWLRGRLQEGRQWMEAALQHDLSPAAQARAHLTLGAMTFAQGDLAASAPAWQHAYDTAERMGDTEAMIAGCAGIGLGALAGGDLTRAEQRFEQTLAMTADTWASQWVHTLTEIWLGTVRLAQGDVSGAIERMESGLTTAQARGDRLTAYVALFNLSQAALASGALGEARTHLVDGVALSAETGDAANLAYVVEALALLESREHRPERVAVLLGAADAMRALAGGSVYGYYLPDQSLRDAAAEVAAEALGPDAYGRLLLQGRGMSFDDVVALVLPPESPAETPTGTPTGWG